MGKTMGNTVGSTVGDRVGDKDQGSRDAAHTCERSRDTTPLLLAIETKQFSAVGNIRFGCSLKTKKERTGTITIFFRSSVSP